MIIKRNGIEIELTSDELFKAYKEQKYLFMYDFVKYYCDDFYYHYNEKQLQVLTTETLEILDNLTNDDDEIALNEAIYNLKRVHIL